VLVWDPQAGAAAYRDGTQVMTETVAAGWMPESQEFLVARRPGGGGFVGEIDEIRLYDRPLASADIVRIP
jgi:hypothetical protein